MAEDEKTVRLPDVRVSSVIDGAAFSREHPCRGDILPSILEVAKSEDCDGCQLSSTLGNGSEGSMRMIGTHSSTSGYHRGSQRV
jgi:hypothetical protein